MNSKRLLLSDAQVGKARHALGLTRQKIIYRNYYVATDDPDWDDLVARGFATKRKGGLGTLPTDSIYSLTKQAALYCLKSDESIDPKFRFAEESP